MEYYTVKQMAEHRKVTERAIYKQIQTHKEELEGHYKKIEGKTWYDEEAAKILEKAAMNSAPSVILTAEKQELEQLKEKIKELEAELDADRKSFREMSNTMKEILEKSAENAQLAAESKLYLEQKSNLEAENQNLKDELEQLKREKAADSSTEGLSDKEIYERAAAKLPNPPRLRDRLFDKNLEHWRAKQAEAITKMTVKEREILFKYGFIGDGK